ncbi:hypothetical protein TWF788_004796 [Orbilia oligospora]|uniref:Zinc finger PHD-type domain-containing protein n=2 Tax=Orbilia oligospora TaxID=2813651 RepID=A0A6G1LZX9_ORBOL|nr:hypothetical protein TWF788_004796 [Orbilia oligospora]KAF3215720.1 hypothetical protein TWF191_009206 [Orbilia oligospora]KAF3238787.1 hypothetical protein TWF192_010252 [Orbilia oligospora]
MPSTRRSYGSGHNQPSGLLSASTQSQSAYLSSFSTTSSPSSSSSSPSSSSSKQTSQRPSANPLHQQWQFAAVWEFLFQFHKGLKSPYYEDIEAFARDISSPCGTPLLHDVQIGLLKNVSSQRGLTIEMFDDYTRRQYIHRRVQVNPFGTDPMPISFYSFKPEQRVLILHQLAMWIISNTDSFRSKIDPHKVMDHTDWRIDPIGWDSKGNTYYQFDNGYLYCRAEPLLPVYQKWKSRKGTGSRSKRRKVSAEEENEFGQIEFPPDENDVFVSQIEWKCLCSTLEEYRALVARFEKSKNLDEKELRKVILEDIIPVLEKEEQKRKKKLLEEERELARLELLSHRKRSARVDERVAKRREAEEREQALRRDHEEQERQEREDTKRQRDEQARIAKLEERERRLQERELRAKQREEERAKLLDPDATESEDNGKGRKSSRQKEKRKAELDIEDNNWVFDCICGVNGVNYDDGTLSIACDRCGVWQHTACLNVPTSVAEESEFVCDRCQDKERAAMSPPIKIKLRLTRPLSSDTEVGDNINPPPLPQPEQISAPESGDTLHSRVEDEQIVQPRETISAPTTITAIQNIQTDKHSLQSPPQIIPLADTNTKPSS